MEKAAKQYRGGIELTITGTDPLKFALDNLWNHSALIDAATGIITNRQDERSWKEYANEMEYLDEKEINICSLALRSVTVDSYEGAQIPP